MECAGRQSLSLCTVQGTGRQATGQRPAARTGGEHNHIGKPTKPLNMGFTITYQPLFTVRVQKDGSNEAVESLRFFPTNTCQQLLDRYQLIFKNRDGGFDVYYKSYPEASSPVPAPITQRIKFTFSIQIIDTSFITTYKPDTMEVPQYYFDNLTQQGNISMIKNLTASAKMGSDDLAVLKQQSFTQRTQITNTNKPTEWNIKEKFGGQATLQSVPITIPTGPPTPVVFVPLNDPIRHESQYIAQEGPYILETDKNKPEPVTIYLSNAIKHSGVNGVLDIHWDSLQSTAPADTGQTYQILVEPK